MSLINVKVGDIEVRDNVRSVIDEKGLDDLAQSIASVGLLEPITVSPNGGDDVVVLVAGHRRFAAIQRGIADGILPGDFAIPAIVRLEATDQDDRVITQLIENLQREDLPVMDEARGFAALKNQGVSQKDIAKRIGRSEAHVSKRLALLRLPDEVQDLVGKGKVPLEVAIALPQLDDESALTVASSPNPTLRDVQIHKDLQSRRKATEKLHRDLEEQGFRVFASVDDVRKACPDGKTPVYGAEVDTVDELPKRVAGVLLTRWGSGTTIQSVTFKSPSKAEQAEDEATAKAFEKQRKAAERDAKALLASVDAFVDNPPAAGELVNLLARLTRPTGISTFTELLKREAEEAGEDAATYVLTEELSTVQARKMVASLVVGLVIREVDRYGSPSSPEHGDAITVLADQLGLVFSKERQTRWQARIEEMRQQAIEYEVATAEAQAEAEADDPGATGEADAEEAGEAASTDVVEGD